MTTINSEKKIINKPILKLFPFLCDLNNWQQLMPDRVIDWRSTADNFYFTIKGTASLGMKKSVITSEKQILLIQDGKVPFDFNMEINFDLISVNQTEVQMILNADLNSLLKMVAVNPLKNFLNMLNDKLEEIILQ
ncbi:MAG: hypothetical protein ABIJ97_11195 [Bacteroidota bacterium]